MSIKAVLFDMFDTLVMIEKQHAFYSPAVKSMHAFLARNGVQISFSAFRDAYIQARDALYDEADQKMEEPHFNMRIQNALKILGYHTEAQSSLVQGATDAFCREFMNYVTLDPQATDALGQLHGKYRLGLVSNFAIPECVQTLLQQHSLSGYFDVIIVSAAVNRRKPNPDIYKYALDKLQLAPAEAVFVGDTVDADVMGPQKIGMKTIYIDRRPQKDLENHKPDQTIKNLNELPTAIQNL
ncbi:MAG: HAD family hydrolase [Candidatus Bathyarchaeota archaeon]|nr:HAD family hydrolase [Candidatus Bathyarchaeota archaeon]